ncbi:hypothetical protein DVT68_01260 [Dyella solisilvae]|uniref:Uncharacterized protein n=1 Tax=Dyella solisilvae TaxID=1920168 RepID=A0A370KAP1_9GAMM|nr:hypothetical protein [Dyella solisilvae]RDI99517.1 hypothetical protein DVT68_01260 [Dyella solisilvae]
MSDHIVIEWEQISVGGVLVNHYLARLVEPITTGHFATVIHEGGAWRVIWYPSGISSQVSSFEVSSLETRKILAHPPSEPSIRLSPGEREMATPVIHRSLRKANRRLDAHHLFRDAKHLRLLTSVLDDLQAHLA